MPTAKTPGFSMSTTLRSALTRREGDKRTAELWFIGVKDPTDTEKRYVLGFQDPATKETYRGYLSTPSELQDFLGSHNLDLAEIAKTKVAKKATVTLVTSRRLNEYVETSSGYRSVARPNTKSTNEVVDSICDF